MFIEQVPSLFRRLYPQALWRINPQEKAVYLTFDDGPIPLVTPWVLSLLKHEGIKATFFMVATMCVSILKSSRWWWTMGTP